MYDLLLLDLDNTLIDRRSTFARWARAYVQQHPAIAGERSMAEARDALLAADGAGLVPRDHFCAGVAALFPPGSRPAVDDVWTAFAAAYIDAVQPEPAVLAALGSLASSYRLALLSNGSGRRQRAKLQRAELGHFFEQIFISGELGRDKPDAALFRHALGVCGVVPERTLMVGDDPRRDIVGALGVGVDACWIAHGRAWETFGLSVEPTFVFDDFPALAQQLLAPALTQASA